MQIPKLFFSPPSPILFFPKSIIKFQFGVCNQSWFFHLPVPFCSSRNAWQIAMHSGWGYSCAAVERFWPPSEPWITWWLWSFKQSFPWRLWKTLILFVRTNVLFLMGVLLTALTNPKRHWSNWAKYTPLCWRRCCTYRWQHWERAMAIKLISLLTTKSLPKNHWV